MNYCDYFKDKKITVMGLGLLGRGIGVIKFLARCELAELLVTDLKTKEQLSSALEEIKTEIDNDLFNKIKFVLGEHRLEDFRGRDLVLKIADVPLDSPFVAEAVKSGAEVTKDAALFCKLRPDVVTIGVTGTRGKTTTTELIYQILKSYFGDDGGKSVYLAGNIKGRATLPLLEQVKDGDVVVAELDSWQLQGFADSRVTPHISVFTNLFPDHLKYYGGDLRVPESMSMAMELYYQDKAQIFRFHKSDDVLVVGEGVMDLVKTKGEKIEGKLLVAKVKDFPSDWGFKLPGEHNKANAMCAILVCSELGVPDDIIRKVVESFVPVPGRLELIAEQNGVKIYNDNNSTTPDATIAGLRAVGDKDKRNVVLIVGGDDKNLDMSGLVAEISKWCSKVVLFKERGTDRIRDTIMGLREKGVEVYEEEGLQATVGRAMGVAVAGEVVLFSPAFSSFGKYFKNEYDRGDQFVKNALDPAPLLL